MNSFTGDSLIIGIDTGGTYTDAVLVDKKNEKVLASAKTPTTHYDLSLGITNALKKLMDGRLDDLSGVAEVHVSTTLATNAVVEDKGSRVGLFVIGQTKHLDLPALSIRYVPGGHTYTGEEEEKLDIEMLMDGIEALRGHVDAYAVAASMSIQNPAHELVAAKAIQLMDPKPVFVSHQVSNRPGMKERAATAVLNAALMPVMEYFLKSMNHSLSSEGFKGKVRIVRGDGFLMDLEKAASEAAFTFASGPAATAIYGALPSDGSEAIVVDVGGTTTDITMIKAGMPIITSDGSVIGEWETHVDAVEMHTVGCGGDSRVSFDREGKLTVGPARVLPISMAGNMLKSLDWLQGEKMTCLCLAPDVEPALALSEPVMTCLGEKGPSSPETISEVTGIPEISLDSILEQLTRMQLVFEIGFTPTDAFHALGSLAIGDSEKAEKAAEILAERAGLSMREFCEKVIERAGDKIKDSIIEYVVQKEMGFRMTAFLGGIKETSLMDVRFKLNMPIIGMGAAARHLLPYVAKTLETEAVFPDHFEVGNALGAVFAKNIDDINGVKDTNI